MYCVSLGHYKDKRRKENNTNVYNISGDQDRALFICIAEFV